MSRNAWRWVNARSIGTSHLKSGLPCQDFALCTEFETASGNVVVAVVSDGAGSAAKAEAGSRMVCVGFLRHAIGHLAAGGRIESVDVEGVLDWLDGIRERVGSFARRTDLRPRDCAATLVGILAGPRSTLVIHVGDGAAVVREEGTADWIVPSWPFHGEYASTTAFVTDDPMPMPAVVHLPIRIDRLAVFSDGIERLVLDHANRIPHGPFFDRMTAPLVAAGGAGFDRDLSRPLRDYLGGDAVSERTDDDTSLILGVRL